MDEAELVDIGVVPEAAISGAVLTQSEYSAFLTFNAVKKNDEGMFIDAGFALVEFEDCLITKFGYPNDEALPGHPLYAKLEEAGGCYDIYKIKNSSWLKKVEDQNNVSFPGTTYKRQHFIVLFHDSTFECLAKDMKVSIIKEPYNSVWNIITERIMNE